MVLLCCCNFNVSKHEFEKYGHTCEVGVKEDDLDAYYNKPGCINAIKKYMFKIRTISNISRLYNNCHLRSQGSIMAERRRHLEQFNRTIHPFSYFRLWWEMYITFVILLQFFLAPLEICFWGLKFNYHSFYPNLSTSLLFVVDISLCTDVVVNCFTGYFCETNKQIVLNGKEIFKNYAKGLLVLDILASLPDEWTMFVFDNTVVAKVKKVQDALNYFRFITLKIYLRRIGIYYGLGTYTVLLMWMILILGMYWHGVTTCLSFVRNFVSAEMGNSTSRKTLKTMTRTEVYLKYFYKTSLIISCTFVQYKPDFDYHKTPEALFIAFFWITSEALKFYILALIYQIKRGTSSSHRKYLEMERQLMVFMGEKQLPRHLKQRLLTFYDYRYQKCYFNESEILSTVSGQLRQEIIMHLCKQLVENVTFFSNLPANLLVRIVSCLKNEIYLHNDVIVKADTNGDCMYFIASGTVAVFSRNGTEICHLEDGDYFGEIALVKQQKRVASVIALEIADVFRFDSKDFVRAIYPYPDLLNTIEHIALERGEHTQTLDTHYLDNI